MAIVRDSTSSGVNGPSQPGITVAHTCTGTDLVLYVSCTSSGGTNSVTYNGVAMTAIKANDAAVGPIYVSTYRLINPPTGVHNIVVTAPSGYNAVNAVSYTGVDQTTPDYGATSVGSTTTNPQTVAASATSVDDWFFLYSGGQRNTTATTNLTLASDQSQSDIFDSNGTVGSTSSRNYEVTISSTSTNYNYIHYFFLKAKSGGGASQNSNFLMFM